MAPLPYNNTGIAFVDYTANARAHTVQFRYGGEGGPPGGLSGAIANILAAAMPFMPTDFAVLGARYQSAGTNFSVPWAVSFGTLTGTGVAKPGEAPAFVSFVGRSALGRRARVYFLGASISAADEGGSAADYRQTTAESANVTNVRNAIIAAGLVAIDSQGVTWYPYANIGYHAYWQRRMRGAA